MRALLAEIAAKPLIQRFATIGVVAGAVIGGIGGLIRGLEVHPATAWFAIVELGVPVAMAGECSACAAAYLWRRPDGSSVTDQHLLPEAPAALPVPL